MGRVGVFFSGFGVCTGRRDLSWGFRGEYLLTEEEMGLSLPSARLVEGQARSESVRLALHLPILTGGFPVLPAPLPAPPSTPFPPRLSSLVLSLPQRFLQALEPEEVTSYFGPDATLGGTCPCLFQARGVSLHFISPWNQGPGILVALLGRGQDGCHPC